MRAKLRLDLTKAYELAIATSIVSDMLVPFIRGHSHSLGIGIEQGDIQNWDDFVIKQNSSSYEYVQVKRQHVPFGPEPDLPSRGLYKQGSRKGEQRDLSPLDESMKTLGTLFTDTGPIYTTVQRTFVVIVPSFSVQIKQGLTANDLYNLCATEITPSTTLAGFQSIASTTPFSNIISWLKTWCGFNNEAHILQALRNFKIIQLGNENDINTNTTKTLSICFNQPDKVLKEISSYIQENTSYTSFITPRPIAGQLISYLLPGNQRWTQFKQIGSEWEISGTHGKVTDEIENASTVVSALWTNPNASVVKYHSKGNLRDKLPSAFIRLVLHLQPASLAHINNVDSWHLEIKKLIGNTLGIAENDCDTLCIIDDPNPHSSSGTRKLELLRHHDDEAAKLSDEMHNRTWRLIGEAIHEKIAHTEVVEVRDAVEERWLEWKRLLDIDINKQKEICKSMLHPVAEGDDIQAELRIGPKTVSLIADGFYILLIIAVCFDELPGTWESIGNQITINVKALRYWSGPVGIIRRVRKLDDEEVIGSLLGKESSKILVLSEVELTSEQILESSLAESEESGGSIASAHRPTLLITNSPKFKRLIRKSNITEIRAFLQDEFKKGKTSKLLP